ncbi:MAG: DNA repair protein RecN [Chitinophagaceae bacterium]
MLQKLHIQNYAIIDEIEIDFSNELNIITGETGAGKSILMGALNLILGERADTGFLKNNAQKCFIEGFFKVEEKKAIQQFLQEADLESEGELVIRREIATNGKSRAFINDTPVTLQQLKSLAALLVDLHQQFDTLSLGEEDFQRQVIDALANNTELVATYQIQYKQWQLASKDLLSLQQQKANFQKEADYHQFLFDELKEAALQENELENIEAELQVLSNSEGIKTALVKSYFELKESEQPVTVILKQLIHQLNQYTSIQPAIAAIVERLQSVHIELQDIANEVESTNDTIYFDEKRIQEINDKLAIGYKLYKKHNVQSTADLLVIQNNLEQQLQNVLQIDDAIIAKEKEVNNFLQQATKTAELIHQNRINQSNPFATAVNTLLQQVGMPNARVQVKITKSALNQFGCNEIEFLFDANKSNRFEPIRKVASGGELSRLMLCIKSMVAKSMDLPTLIFDEIDTGISGEAAKQVGIIMKNLATNRQIICITHQPQIAGKANTHFFVYKEAVDNTIKTNVRILSKEERITAIAQMLSGEKPTAAALENAREMVMQ